VSVITMNEIRYGKRMVEARDPAFGLRLDLWYREILAAPFLYAIVPIGLEIAEQAADFRAAHGTSVYDSLIAATAKVHGHILATRNIGDFQATGVPLVNPWEYSA
jgi:predicted nucleic acid-binding protein